MNVSVFAAGDLVSYFDSAGIATTIFKNGNWRKRFTRAGSKYLPLAPNDLSTV